MTLDLLDMDTEEIKEMRKEFLIRHNYLSQRGKRNEANRYSHWICKFGEELNYRCKTTKYIPR